jgi:cyclic pyranopterin phosphate synthase
MRDGADDAGLVELIQSVWQQRGDRYSELRATRKGASEKVEMYYIGG